ncbi:TetR family transcriptional regulator [Streptomyces sp. NPDC005195]|uniref:TetR family transcriptional regulator n=1 Tax=Streptomyces sp. NPDC005195 TaxID=3154561 RepID=UPI0033AA9728
MSGRRCVREHRRPRFPATVERQNHADDHRPGPRSATQGCSLQPPTHPRGRPAETAAGPDASLDSIAQAAGFARRTLYGHFPSRYVLVAELAQEATVDSGRRSAATAFLVAAGVAAQPAALQVQVQDVVRRVRAAGAG